MNSKIKILDQGTINLIAAGEVIERPASVVKELIENALDAGSKNITIEVHGGGLPFIRISDDGYGMSKDDLLLALERHTTSKIDNAGDLFNIKTYGFRGEALPSIAGISKLEVMSKRNDNELSGVWIYSEGGHIVNIDEKGLPEGTTFLVKDIFYNLPARRKYIKKDITEFTHINNIVEKFIIAKPDVKFKLLHDGKEIISSLGNGKLMDVLITLFGLELKNKLLHFEAGNNAISINGYIGQPLLTYPNRTKEIVFVNDRYIYAPLITHTLEDEYKHMIPNGRYPFCVIFVGIDPRKIDVNVHPAKKEIRFEKVNEVLSIFRNAINKTLKENGIEKIADFNNETRFNDSTSEEMKQNYFTDKLWKSDEVKPNFEFISLDRAEVFGENKEPYFQYKNTFLVTVIGEELVIIDQHVAHERILYERLSKNSSEELKSQELLLPLNLEVSPIEKKIILGIIEEIKNLGYVIQEFGHNSFIVRAVPQDIYDKDHTALLKDLIEEFKESITRKNIDEIREKILITISCKSAIKAGQKLNYDEIRNLIRDLRKTEHPNTCPHGRPIIYKISEENLQKIFKRR